MKKLKRIIITVLIMATVTAMGAPLAASAATPDLTQIMQAKTHTTSDGYELKYRIYVPDDYSPDKKYPLVLFFHGAGEKGNDNATQLKTGITTIFSFSNSEIYQSIVIAPQCPLLTPDTAKWVDVPNWVDGCSYSTDLIPESKPMKAVVDLLGAVRESYSTDVNRWYVTGLSMGGFATWDIITRHPELWAAAAPVCGGADYRKAELIKDLPIWTFHGLQDPTVPYQGTEKMVNRLKEIGSTSIKYTEIASGKHDIWSGVYSTYPLYTWMFSQTRPEPEVTETEAQTTAPVTEAPVTETEAQTEAPEKSGCGASAAALPLTAVVGASAVALKKKRKK